MVVTSSLIVLLTITPPGTTMRKETAKNSNLDEAHSLP